MSSQTFTRRAALTGLSLGAAGAAWPPALQLFFSPDADTLSPTGPLARGLMERLLSVWERRSQAEIDRMRRSNPEWDFMGRTFLVLALADLCLHEPDQKPRYLAVIDQIIDDTLRVEQQEGMFHFLLPYATAKPFVSRPTRSLFIDGEIALCLAARLAIEPERSFQILLIRRIQEVLASMESAPILCAESYPDECWSFCNTAALAAIRLTDFVTNQDHTIFFQDWLDRARGSLLDPETGMLVSSFTYGGEHMDGPEGSSIWFSAHCLRLIDPGFAREQYDLARAALGRTLLGFGYAREWPASWQGPADIDSGPIVPVVEASAGASGLALLGARSFGDDDWLEALVASLDLAAFPVETEDGRTYAASNVVGDAVMLCALVAGPLWQQVIDAPDDPPAPTQEERRAKAKARRGANRLPPAPEPDEESP